MHHTTSHHGLILRRLVIASAIAAAFPAYAAEPPAAENAAASEAGTTSTASKEAGAKEASAQEPNAQESNAELAKITVTSTRRKESLQSVPVAVTVLSGEELEQANRNNVKSIADIVPTLNFGTSASNKDSSLFIRGIGTISTSPGVEPSVSTVIDGVVYARPGQATLDLADIDRVEVLRGPQGTLFGKNASAGVLNIVTKEPSKELNRYIDASYFGGGNERRIKAGVSGEIVPDTARGSLSLLWGDYDGNVTNVYNGDKVNGYNREGIRGKLELTPSETLKISLAADYLKSQDTIPVGVAYSNSTTAYPTGVVTATSAATVAANSPVVASTDNRSINNNSKSYVDDKNQGVSAQVDWLLGDYTLTSITAYRTWDNKQYLDNDRLPAVVSGVVAQTQDTGTVDFSQFSQEVRLASPKGKFLEYVSGLYYMKTDNDETYRRDIITAVNTAQTAAGTSQTGIANYSVNSRSFSAFGESTLNFTPQFRGIAGLRWTDDDLEYTHNRVSTAADTVAGIRPSNSSSGSTSSTALSGRIGPQFDFSKNVTGYATYSHGYKGPAFNVFFNADSANGSDQPIKPETSNSYEIGLKSLSFANRLRVNAAAFYTAYDNYQANYNDVVAGTPVTRLINAGEVSSRGAELDFAAKLSDRLTLSGALARIDARIDNFLVPSSLTGTALAAAQVNGQPLPFSPDWKTNVQASYRFPLDNGLFVDASTDYRWQSKVQYQLTQTPDTIQGAYGIWNASVGLSDPNKGWRVALLVNNIADKSYAASLAQANGVLYRVVPRDDQRYFGINARYDF